MDGRVFEKFQKKISNSRKGPKSFPKVSKRVLDVFWGKLFEKCFAQFCMEGRVLENFQKNQKKSNFLKRPKSSPKESKRVSIVFWDNFSEKFLPSFPWKVDSSKFFEKIKKISKSQKRLKSFPKESKRVLNVFWGKLFEKFFCPVFRGGSRLRNFSKKYEKCENSK